MRGNFKKQPNFNQISIFLESIQKKLSIRNPSCWDTKYLSSSPPPSILRTHFAHPPVRPRAVGLPLEVVTLLLMGRQKTLRRRPGINNSSRATQMRDAVVVLRTTRSASPRMKPGGSRATQDEERNYDETAPGMGAV